METLILSHSPTADLSFSHLVQNWVYSKVKTGKRVMWQWWYCKAIIINSMQLDQRGGWLFMLIKNYS